MSSKNRMDEHRSKKQVLMLPDWRYGNPYLDQVAAGLRHSGYQARFCDYPSGLLPLNRAANANPGIANIHLQWTNGYIDPLLWSDNRAKRLARLALLVLDIWLLRARGRRVVWTIHNLVTHEARDVASELRVGRILAQACHCCFAHSESARRKIRAAYQLTDKTRIDVVPHGNYIGLYSDPPGMQAALRKRLNIQPDNTVLLFFGNVRQYKGLLEFLPCFAQSDNANLRLIVAGPVRPPALRDQLEAAAKDNPRIRLLPGFVPEDQVAALHALADAVLIPFNRTLTSGSALLAMSLGKALILPTLARELEVTDERGAHFYQDLGEASTVLKQLDKPTLATMGQHNRQLAEQLDWNDIAAGYARHYR